MFSQREQRNRPVAVADVFALDSLVAAGIEVVAGHSGLEREVTWVHAGEIADIATFLRGGELLLTAGSGIGHSPRAQAKYVQSLAEAGASGLVLELGRSFRATPAAILTTANRVGLPTAILRKDVPFAEVTRAVHGWIIGRRYELRERAEHIALDFNELLLSGGSVAQVIHKLYELTGKSSFLEDAAHQLVEYAGEESEVDGLIAQWATHTRADHHPTTTDGQPNTSDEGWRTCACSPVVLRGESWGRLHLIRSRSQIDDLDRLAVERAASAVGLALMNSRHHARLAERAQADFLGEAARHAPTDPKLFMRQARSLGANFAGCKLIAIAMATGGGSAGHAVAEATAAANAGGLQILGSSDGPESQVLLGVPNADDAAETARKLAEKVYKAGADPSGLTIGVSRPTSVPQLPRAFQEAAECLRFARLSETAGVLEYSDLGLHLLLAKLADSHELSAFVEEELGPLLEYDAKARSPLLPTLQALLAHDNNRAEAARVLHMERRSIYYRLGRIEKVLGKDLDAYDTRLSLGVALRALSLMQDRVRSLTGARALSR